MKHPLYLPFWVLFLLTSPALQAQILDNFSDGNFTQNPVWTGDSALFKISAAGELQLNATAPGQAALWTSGNMPDSNIWDFQVRLAFDPSNQNLVRVYLQADQTELSLAQGYFIEMGETGSADAIRFFRQDGASKTLLATGQVGLAAVSPNLQFHVTRSASGDWAVEAGTVGTALQAQFSLSDNTHTGGPARFFGVQCVFTVSNATKFYFDNVNIRPDVPDTQAPVLISASAPNATQVNLIFNENLDPISAENTSAYSLNNGVGQPLSAVLSPDQKTVVLTLSAGLNTGIYTVQANGIQDVLGNESSVQTIDFQYVKIETPSSFDLIITEIMADPTPSAGLPEVEWFEIFNRTNKTFDLSQIQLTDASSAPITFPTYFMAPGQYLAICATANAAALQVATGGFVLGIPMSASLLNNDGDILTIRDLGGKVIDRVAYDVAWHTVAGKSDGGYTLERSNLNLPCLGAENWGSSPAQLGGTPAAQNANFTQNQDQEAPQLLRAFPESPTSILLTFSEGLDKSAAEETLAYQFSPFVAILSAIQVNTNLAQVRLTLNDPLQAGILYTLEIENSVTDCSGNPYSFTEIVRIGLAQTPDSQDIVINEILFNPPSGGARYIEFYNRSNKIFDWSKFFLASNTSNSSSVVAVVQDRLFLPGAYHVLSTDAAYVRNTYSGIISQNVLQNSLPSLDDKADSIKIYWTDAGQLVTLDAFYYQNTMHNALLSTSEQEGIALERLRADRPSQDNANWTSASSLITGAPGTPTLPNSQAQHSPQLSDEWITIPLERLSPDGDGREDFLEIIYQVPEEGFVASLTIYDADGNNIKSLLKQQLIGRQGVIRWDGDTDAGLGGKSRPGIHVLYIEMFHPNGEVRRIKKAIALVGQF